MATPYSHKVQEMLNYYDVNATRLRTYPYTVDAQILNIAGNAMEDLDLRYQREVKARFLTNCPLHLDNQGLYTAARLPNTFTPPDEGTNPPLNLVTGLRQGQWSTLPLYDDRVPTATRISIDTTRKVTAFSAAQIFDWISDGRIQYLLTPALTLPIPSKLSLWLDGLNAPGAIDILITGIAYPRSAWQSRRTLTSETVSYRQAEGLLTTRTVWYSIESIVVRNAPVGAHLAVWHMPFNLPSVLDAARPYTHSNYRGKLFDRYWTRAGNWLNETFYGGTSVGFANVTSYGIPEPIEDIAIDPSAYTLLAVSTSKLYTIDRRAVMPGRLELTAITSDPVFSVNVVSDPGTPSATARYVEFQVLAHDAETTPRSFRFILEDPNGGVVCVDAKGNFITYSGGSGWSSGAPRNVTIPLQVEGTYVVTLESIDMAGLLTADRFPYPNLNVNVVSTLDLTTILPEAKGIARDSLEQLWIWTGTYAIPVQLHFDAYIYDSNSRTVFLTDPFEQVKVA